MSISNKGITALDADYREWITRLGERIRSAQIKAAVRVNSELLRLYWSIGADLVEKSKTAKWGEGWLEATSRDLLAEFPEMKGFSYRNLKTIRQWYQFYSEIAIGKQPVSQFDKAFFTIPWGHHIYILQRCKSVDKAIFYLRKTVENNWSRAVLLNFLDTNLYEREGKAVTNFASALPVPGSDLAQNLTRDPYCFDFLEIADKHNERQLKDALVANIEKFLLELGTGFAYMGREYRLEVGDTEQFIDMLFYNVRLKCYIVIEVKTCAFEAGFVGQLGAYTVAVDHLLRKEGDNKTIGLLICKTKDNVFAQYSLESTNQPIGISEYELSSLYPANVEGTIPTVEEIESRLADVGGEAAQ